MQKLLVNNREKKVVHKKYLRSKKVLYTVSYFILIFALIFSCIFLVYGLGNKSAFVVNDITDSDFGKKNILLMLFILGTVDIILAFIYTVYTIFIKRITGRNISERVNETLLIKQDSIEYGYQNYVGSVSGDRVIVQIPFRYLSKIIYSNPTKEIVFRGKYTSKYYEDYKKKTTRADDKLFSDDFIIFDYFEPSLINSLEKAGLMVTKI